LVLTLLGFVLTSFVTIDLFSEWSLKKDKNGVKVFTRKVEGYSLKEYKAITFIKTDLKSVEETILDVSTWLSWQHNCKEAKLVTQTGNTYTVYNAAKAPVVKDRDMVIEMEVVRLRSDQTQIKMRALKGVVPEKDGMVRMTYLKGHWLLTPQNGGVEVLQQVHADPAGKIPDWVANSSIVDSPFKTMGNLKERLEN
ncbi:MAG: START domain-containing protein, partial [Bacteroidota bacterium]